jgi:hypothetical protein
VTGDEKEWSVEELKAGKPILLYYYVEGMDGANGSNDPSYKFSQSFEMGGLSEKVVAELNDKWRCKKVGMDLDADRKQAKNQARIEFWSFTGVRMGDITVKEAGRLSSLEVDLKQMRVKNAAICAKEIKRVETLEKARIKAEKDTAAK